MGDAVNRPLVIIFATLALDAIGVSIGIGLIFPILRRLIADVTHAANVALDVGKTAISLPPRPERGHARTDNRPGPTIRGSTQTPLNDAILSDA